MYSRQWLQWFRSSRQAKVSRPARHRCAPPFLEVLEARDLPATITINAGQVVRAVAPQILGINLAWWDTSLNTAQTKEMVQAAGLTMFRFPGGSSSDTWHFNVGPTYGGEGTSASMAQFIASVGGVGLVTLNYGTGSPQEAAALLAYLNGSPGNTTSLGMGQEWNSSTSTWVQVNWQTAGYWASLRAATPVTPNDGLNFLRIGRAAPFAFHYYEVGNEIYGSWETDEHGSGGDPGKPHDPATYVAFAKQFAAYATLIDPTISIGEVTGSISYDNNWTPNVLTQDASQGFTPGFLSDHQYVQGPGSENDTTLLYNTVSNPSAGGSGSPPDWVVRANDYRALLTSKLGAAGNQVELLGTEYNTVYSNPGKQSTSLVNGLWTADSLGTLLISGYNGANFWDLRNGWSTGNNNSATLYGWRQGGDYGILGSSSGTAPATGTYVPYPTYFAEQLVAKMVHAGDTVVQVTNGDAYLDAYAVKQATGDLDLLVINKSPTTDLTEQFQISGFAPGSQAQLWQYGEVQDTAQSMTTDGHSALASSTVALSLSGSNFSYTFPSYSMSVLDLSPAATGFFISPPSPVTASSAFNVTVTAHDGSGNTVTGYTGTVQFSSTDSTASLPGNVTLTNGVGSFPVTLNTVGTWTVKAQDTVTGIIGVSGNITVNPAVAITTASLANWTVNQPGYSRTIQATGGTGALVISSPAASLPPGLTLSGSGVLSGTPSAAGSYTFTVTATDTVGASASQIYTVIINPPLTITTASLSSWTVNVAGYSQQLTTSGGTGAIFFGEVGALPPGLTFSSGLISGTPTGAGSYSFSVNATDSLGASSSQSYTLVINSPVIVTTTSLANWTAGLGGYRQTVSASGGTGAFTFSASGAGLPPGLTLDPSGILSGTPTTAGSYDFILTATDSVGAVGSQSCTLAIAPPVSITTTTLPTWTANLAGYSQSISASGGTGSLTFSATGTLPTGLSLSSTGGLSGMPTAAGTFDFTVIATDTVGASASTSYTVTINPALTLIPGVLSVGLINTAYNKTISASGGTGTVTLVVTNVTGAIPGLNVPTSATGTLTISGTPTATGTEKLTVTATDSLGASTTTNYSILINPATVYLTLPPSGFVGYPGGTVLSFPISINELQDQQTTNHVGLATATLAVTYPTGVFGFPTGINNASSFVHLGSVPLSDTVAPGGAADWTLSATSLADGQLNITLSAKTGKNITSNSPATGGSLVTVDFPVVPDYAPASPTDQAITVVAANGSFHTSIIGNNGTYTLKPLPPYAGIVTIDPAFSYQVKVVGPSTVSAGSGFLMSVQAVDSQGNLLTSYSGPSTVTASISPNSPGSGFPVTVGLNSSGFGLFLANIQQVGTYTISVADSSGTFSGSAPPVTVTAGYAAKLGFASEPASTPVGVTLPPVSVQILDLYGNVVISDNSDAVTLSVASGPVEFLAGSSTSATVHNGVATFNNLSFSTPGSYTLSAQVPFRYAGPNSTAFTVEPLEVVPGSLVGTPSGFSLQFNAPYLVNAATPVIFGHGFGAAAPVPSVTLTQTRDSGGNPVNNLVEGSLVLNPTGNSLTFVATNTAYETNTGSPILPDGTYTVVIHSSAATNGFQALASGGGFLDGLGTGVAGSGDFTATFTVHASGDDILWAPATADGPGQPLSAPGMNQAGGGYPIYLNDSTGKVTSIQLTLNYDPALLTITGVSGAGFALLDSSTPGQAVLGYSGPPGAPGLPVGNQIPIGYVNATVPSGTASSPMPYKAKDLLHFSGASLNGGSIAVTTSDALHLVAYVGDVDGNGAYTSSDAVLITRVALETDSGFVAYPLIDPVLVADTDGSGFIPADSALQVNEAGVGFPTTNLPSPPLPSGVYLQSGSGAAPGLRLSSNLPTASNSNLAQPASAFVTPQPRLGSSTRADEISALSSPEQIALDALFARFARFPHGLHFGRV
jgi:hypothetical protein